MRLKLYRAPGMADAMRQVRADLGGEAIILSTRRVADGVEVTAGLEQEAELPAPVAIVRPAPSPPSPAPRAAAPPDPDCGAHAAALSFHGASPGLRRKLGAGPLPFALSAVFRFRPLPLGQGARPLLLVGPPGAGKTLTAARLATRLVLGGTQPLVITADGQRAGATEQLASFTRLLGLNLMVASQPASLQRALGHRVDGAPVLIDAPGCDPFDPAQLDAIAALANSVNATVAVVLPAGLDPGEAADIAAAHVGQGAGLLVATRFDVARRLGSVLAAAEAGLALAEAGIGPGAADGLVQLSPEMLAQRLMQAPTRSEVRS